MTAKQNEVQFTVNLETDVLERLKSMAEHGDISRHKLMVNILTTGIEEIELLNHVGIFQLALIIRNMTESTEQAEKRKAGEIHASDMPVPLRIEHSLSERLHRLADRGELNRQRLARNIIKVGLEELESARKLKLTNVALAIRDMHDLFKNVLEIGKNAFQAGKEVKSNES